MRDKIRKQIDKQIWFETDIDGELTPGFIVAVIDGESEMALPFGRRSRDGNDSISVNDVFELGSITKVFTAALFSELDRKGLTSLESEFDQYIPEGYQNPSMSGITVADILAHQSGLPRDPTIDSKLGNTLRAYESYTQTMLLEEYHNFSAEHRIVYSNLGYALLQEALADDYESMLKEHLLMPNGLDNTGLGIEITAPGYGVNDKLADAVNFGEFSPSGGLRSTTEDLIDFVRYCLNDAPTSMWEIRGSGMSADLKIALGWHCIEQRNGIVYAHTGRTLGHTSFLGICPATQTAVIILANSETGTDDLGLEILRIMNNNWHRKN